MQYFGDILRLLGPANCDGITIHAYTHGDDPALVTSDAKVSDGRFANYFWNFHDLPGLHAGHPSQTCATCRSI